MGTARLSKDEGDFQRVLRNVDVESIQKVFTTVQNQIHILQEDDLNGLTEQ